MTHTIFSLKNGQNLAIAEASVTDAPPLIHYLNIIGGESDFLTFGKNEFPLSINEEAQLIKEMGETNQGLMLVGKIGGEIVSQLYVERSCNVRLMHIGEIGLTVKKKYWGNAIGTHMVSMAINWAKQNAVTKLQLHVRIDNEPAIQVYKKFGFSVEGTISHAIKVNNVYFDNFLMGLKLD